MNIIRVAFQPTTLKQSLATTFNENAIEPKGCTPRRGAISVGSKTQLRMTVRYELRDRLEQFTVTKNQTVSVGDTHAADVVIPLRGLKSQQFELSITNDMPAISALTKTPPLLVNGKTVKQAYLVDGDVVEVGEATLRISIVGGHIAHEEKDAAAQSVGAVTVGAVVAGAFGVSTATPKSKPPVFFEVKQHANGVFETFVPRDSAPAEKMRSVNKLICSLSNQLNSLIVLDRQKMGEDFDAVPAESKPLFNWLPADAITTSTPMVIDPKTVES